MTSFGHTDVTSAGLATALQKIGVATTEMNDVMAMLLNECFQVSFAKPLHELTMRLGN